MTTKIARPVPRAPAPHLEKTIEHKIRLRLADAPDLVLWRHSAAPTGQDAAGNFFRGGLPAGCPDLIGILLRFGVGIFFALEIKSPTGRTTPHQDAFHDLIRRFGGFCAVVRSEEEAVAALHRARRGALE